jgi:hypothetical protein
LRFDNGEGRRAIDGLEPPGRRGVNGRDHFIAAHASRDDLTPDDPFDWQAISRERLIAEDARLVSEVPGAAVSINESRLNPSGEWLSCKPTDDLATNQAHHAIVSLLDDRGTLVKVSDSSASSAATPCRVAVASRRVAFLFGHGAGDACDLWWAPQSLGCGSVVLGDLVAHCALAEGFGHGSRRG